MARQISAIAAAVLFLLQANINALCAAEENAGESGYTAPFLSEKFCVRGIVLGGDAKIRRKQDNHYYMTCGCAMITTDCAVQVDTCGVQTYAKANTTFVMHSQDKVTRILNLSDRHRESLKIVMGTHHLYLNPGDEIAVTEGIINDPQELVPFDGLKFRRPQLIHADGMTALIFEFSLADALKHCAIFRRLRESSAAADHELLEEIVKTAAAVNTMYAKSREKYTIDGRAPDEKEKVAGASGTAI